MSRLHIGIKPSTGVIYGLALALVLGIGLFFRVYFSYHDIFPGNWVRFAFYDPWYHARLIENLVHHFPDRIYFDPYTYYPNGQEVFFAPFFDLLIGFFVWVIGLGSPSRHLIETVSVYFPPILGALVSIPVYFIGKKLFSRTAGLIAAALVIILPGQFFLRSLLGFTDHHVAETLFSTLAMLFLILALKSSQEKELSFNNLRRRDWATIKKPLFYSLLAGISLGFYLLSWVGGSLIVLTILAYAVIQCLSDHLRGKSTDYLCLSGIFSFLIALLIVAPFAGQISRGDLHIASLLLGILAFLVLGILSTLMTARNIKRIYYPVAIAVLGGIGFAAFYLVDPSLLKSILNIFSVLTPGGSMQTVAEVRGLSVSLAWNEFTTSSYISLISLAILTYFVIRKGEADKTLLLVWSVVMLVATLGQNRFAYYSAVNVALLTGYLCWKVLDWGIFRKVSEESAERGGDKSGKKSKEKVKPGKKAKRKKARARREGLVTLVTRHPAARYVYIVVAIIIIFFLVFYPNFGKAITQARNINDPHQDWYDSLIWMRDNTPDPFENPDFFYGTYGKPSEGEDYDYPESAYGVMSWWDYGHWITYIAHRIPNTNPHQAGVWGAATFFTSQDESSANGILDERGSRYVIIDYPMAMHIFNQQGQIYGKFYAIIDWANKNKSDFFETYYQKQDGKLKPVILYYPAYYESMCARLYLFDGETAVPNNSTLVVSYTARTDRNGKNYKEITSVRRFATYEEAKSYLDSQTGTNCSLVGDSPYISAVPLEKLEHYKLVHESPPTVSTWEGGTIARVKIFEYTP